HRGRGLPAGSADGAPPAGDGSDQAGAGDRREALAPAGREGRDAAARDARLVSHGARSLRADGDGDRAGPGARPPLEGDPGADRTRPRDRRDPAASASSAAPPPEGRKGTGKKTRSVGNSKSEIRTPKPGS